MEAGRFDQAADLKIRNGGARIFENRKSIVVMQAGLRQCILNSL
jgi:hypothetical protein